MEINSYILEGNIQDYFIFISQPLIQIPSYKYCSDKGQIQRILQPSSLNSNQFLGWSISCGIHFIDFSTPDNIITQQINLNTINSLIVAQQQANNYIWFSNLDSFSIFDFTQIFNPTLIASYQRQIQENPPLKLLISKESNIILLQSKRNVEIFFMQTQGKGLIAQDKINLEENINTIEYLASGYILLGTDSKLITYKLNYSLSSKSISHDQKCITASSFEMLNMLLLEEKHLLIVSKFNGIWRVNLSQFIEQQNCDLLILQNIQEQNGYIFMKHLITSNNQLFLFSELQFMGIQIFEMNLSSEKNTLFPLLQQIEIKDMSQDIALSLTQNHIIRTTDSYINIYFRASNNFQDSIPNIENGEQNVIQKDILMQSDMARRCTLKNNYLYFSKIVDGVFIYKQDQVTNYLQRYGYYKPIEQKNYEAAVPLTSDPNKVIIGVSSIHFVDFSNLSNPTILITNFGLNNFDADCIVLNKKETIVYSAVGKSGFITIDISDFSNPVLLSNVYHPITYYQSASSENVMLDNKEEYAFVSYRDMGVVVYDVRDVANVKYVSSIITYSLEDLQLSSDGTFMVLANQERGIMIVDITDKANMKQISSIFVEGRTQSVSLIQNEQFILCASLLRGQVQLIDIRDKTNPQILQKYFQKGFSNADYICVNQKQDVAYVILHSAILIMHLYSSSLMFNVDTILTQSGSTVLSNKVVIETSSVVRVGEVIQIKLNQIYPTEEVKLKSVSYYDNYQHYDLPSWAIFSENDQLLTIQLTKESFDKSSNKTITVKQFIYQGKVILNQKDFIREDIGINPTESQTIFSICKSNQIIDVDSLVIESSQDTILKLFSSYVIEQQQHILFVLKKKIFYYPIFINTQESLSLNTNGQFLIIESISDTIKVTISINPTQGVLIKGSYAGVLVYYTENQNQMRLEGNLKYINNILANGGFRIANNTNPKLISLNMTIDDTINHSRNYTFKGSDTKLSRINKPVYIGQKNIQKDFSGKFSDSSVYILESFSYSFSLDVFKDDDSDSLTYTAKVQIDGEYQQIPDQYWLSFQNEERTLFAQIQADQYLDDIYLKIIATDGYTIAEDYLKIRIRLVPLWYIASTVLKILGPIIGFFGMWRYKSSLCNYLRKRSYQSQTQTFYTNTQLNLQIPLLEDYLQIAQHIWEDYYKQVDKKLILKEINQLKIQMIRFAESKLESFGNSPNNNNVQYNLQFRQDSNVDKKENLSFRNNDQYGKEQSGRTPRNDQNKQLKFDQFNKTSSLSSKQDNKLFQKLKTMNIIEDKTQTNILSFVNIQEFQEIDTEQVFSQTQLQSAKDQNKDLQRNRISLVKNASLKIQEKIKKRKVQKKISKLIQEPVEGQSRNSFFLQSGYIDRQSILLRIYEFCQNNPRKYSSEIMNQLNQDSSKLSRCIVGLCALSLSQLEQTSQTILNLMKQIAVIEGYMMQEWYKAYVKIEPQPQQVFEDPFPSLNLKESALEKVLVQLQQKGSNKDTSYSQDILASIPLAKDCLEAITFGFTLEKKSYFQKIRGECLEVRPHQILCIKTYRPVKSDSFICCRGQKAEVYIKKELSQNSILPSWINSVDISNGVLLISGNVQNKDAGQYALKIYDTSYFILKDIRINILPKESPENETNVFSPSQQTTRQEYFDQNYEQVEEKFKQIPLETEIPPIKSQIFKQINC